MYLTKLSQRHGNLEVSLKHNDVSSDQRSSVDHEKYVNQEDPKRILVYCILKSGRHVNKQVFDGSY